MRKRRAIRILFFHHADTLETVVLLRRKNIDDHLECMWTDEEFGDHVRTKKVGKKMINKQIQITADGKVQSLDLKIEFDETDMDDVTSMTIKTNYQGKEIIALGVLPVGVFHDDLGNFSSINGVGQIPRMDRIEAVRVQRVIEIDDVELRFDWITAVVIQ